MLYRKPRSVVAPDYAWHETDRWIVFPWSAQPPVTGGPRGERASVHSEAPPSEARPPERAWPERPAAKQQERGAMTAPAIDGKRLLADLDALAAVGDTGDGGNCRLALTDEDAGGRELVVGWMRDLGLTSGSTASATSSPPVPAPTTTLDPVMTGSHIDTVRTGGRYDGTLGVLAGLEVVRALDDAGVRTRRPLAVAFFTDEEGSRFAPDMLGQPRLRRRHGARGRARGRRHRRRRARRGARAHRVGRRRRRARAGAARLRRAAHRAGPAARGAGRDHRGGHRGAGHLVAGADAHRPVQPRRHHPDAAAARRRASPPPRSPPRSGASPSTSAATRSGPSAASTCIPTWSTSWRRGRR